MKPIQVAVLVAVAAVGGGLFTKWLTSRQTAPAAASVVGTPAPAAPATRPTPVAAQPPEEALPSPFIEEKARKEPVLPHKTSRARPAHIKMVAHNEAPPVTVEVPVPTQAPARTPALAAPEPTPAVQPQPEPPAPPAPPPPPEPRQVTLTAGTLIPARTVESLSSERNAVGDTFTATLDQPLVVDGLVIAERGAHLEGRVVQSQRAGRIKGASDLAIELTRLFTSDGQRIAIETDSFEKHGASASKMENAGKVGAGAAIGAAIGAIAGGGAGAGIGAAVGGAAGAGGAVATRSKSAVLAPETHINFRLRNSVAITERQGVNR